jgi:hypothetical protein
MKSKERQKAKDIILQDASTAFEAIAKFRSVGSDAFDVLAFGFVRHNVSDHALAAAKEIDRARKRIVAKGRAYKLSNAQDIARQLRRVVDELRTMAARLQSPAQEKISRGAFNFFYLSERIGRACFQAKNIWAYEENEKTDRSSFFSNLVQYLLRIGNDPDQQEIQTEFDFALQAETGTKQRLQWTIRTCSDIIRKALRHRLATLGNHLLQILVCCGEAAWKSLPAVMTVAIPLFAVDLLTKGFAFPDSFRGAGISGLILLCVLSGYWILENRRKK